jgi:hypothetical protein
VYDYAKEHGKLLYPDGEKTREIPIDTANWEKKDGGSMTHSMGF